jgi:hypothetical protein
MSEITEYKEVHYSRSRIVAWKVNKHIVCHLYRNGCKNQPLNLGECNDGSPFTSVNQAINQAKQIIDYLKD